MIDTLDQFPVLWSVWRKGDANAAPWTTGGTWERRFYDGLGRLVETQTPDYDWTGAANTHKIVVYTQYDGLGQATATSVPYQRLAYQYAQCGGQICTPYAAPDLNQPRTQYQYDPLGRATQVTNPDGSTARTTYDQWITTAYNEENHKVEREVDGLGRMTLVREYLGANPYTWYTTTTYGCMTRASVSSSVRIPLYHN